MEIIIVFVFFILILVVYIWVHLLYRSAFNPSIRSSNVQIHKIREVPFLVESDLPYPAGIKISNWFDPSTQSLTSAMVGEAHNLHLYSHFNQPVSRYEKIADHCLHVTRNQCCFRNTLEKEYFDPHLPSREVRRIRITNASQRSVTNATLSVVTVPITLSAGGERIFKRVEIKLFAIGPRRLKTAEALYQIEMGGQTGGNLGISIVNGKATVKVDDGPKTRVWFSKFPETINKLLDGKLNTTIAYIKKRLKIKGDIALGMKLEALLR